MVNSGDYFVCEIIGSDYGQTETDRQRDMVKLCTLSDFETLKEANELKASRFLCLFEYLYFVF